MKKVVLVVAVLALVGAAFFGGTLFASGSAGAPRAAVGGARGAMNGPLADMTEEERTAFQSMTEEERTAFLEEQGVDTSAMPSGPMAGGPARGGLLEGEVVEVASDTITVALTRGGSQTIYYDGDTVIAFAEGAGDLSAGVQVLLFAESETDGVTTAQAIIVQ